MKEDPILAEVRANRDEYAAQFDYDLKAMYEDLKNQERLNPKPHQQLAPKSVIKSAIK